MRLGSRDDDRYTAWASHTDTVKASAHDPWNATHGRAHSVEGMCEEPIAPMVWLERAVSKCCSRRKCGWTGETSRFRQSHPLAMGAEPNISSESIQHDAE